MAGALVPFIPMTPAGAAAWLAAILIWPDISYRTRIQTGILSAIGVVGMAWGYSQSISPDLGRALSANVGLIGLLIGVSFLQLVAMPADAKHQPLPRGRDAFWTTMIGAHLFGAVINLSSSLIVADRIRVRGRLAPRQTLLLVRALTAAAFWSPFFGSMAAALVFAPGANLGLLMIAGVPITCIALLFTWQTVGRRASPQFVGYPIRYDSLRVPGLMAVAVIIIHLLYPSLSVIALISLLGPLLAVSMLLPRGGYGRRQLHQQVVANLPRMGNELGLFLSAGVLAAGLGSVLAATGDWLPFVDYGPVEASLALICMVLLGAVGVHPVISVAALATLLAPLQPNQSLLAMTFLCGWGVGVAVNPMSGVALSFQGRYGVDGFTIPRLNAGYGAVMTLVCCVALTALWWVVK